MIIFNAISILKDDLNKNIPKIKWNLIDWTNKVKMMLKEKKILVNLLKFSLLKT
jgi:hypothetical protein